MEYWACNIWKNKVYDNNSAWVGSSEIEEYYCNILTLYVK